MLELFQLLLLGALGVVSVISSPRASFYNAFEGLNVPLDFQAITLSYADLFMLLLVVISGLRAFAEDDYRLRLGETIKALLAPRRAGLFVAFLALMLLGVLWAKQPSLLLFTTLHYAACLLLVFVAADLVRARGLSVLWALLIGGALQAVIAILQVLNNDTLGLSAFGETQRLYYEPTDFFRASGLSMHPNYLGGYLMLAWFAAVWLTFQAWQRKGLRWLPLTLGALCAVGLIGTLSRSALLSTAVGSLPLVLIGWRALHGKARRVALGVAAAGALAAVALAVFAVRGDVMTRFFSGREFFFADSWNVIQSAPILGVGAGNLMHQVWLNVGVTLEPKLPVHNVYLYVWAETGLIGLLIFTAAWLINLITLQPVRGAAYFIMGCGVLALAVVSLFDNYTWAVHPHRVITFWWLGIWWGTTWQTAENSLSRGAPSA